MNQLAASSDDIALFLRVVELGSFAAVAEQTSLTPSGVSKTISRLEDRLGVRLLQRTTRKLTLTPEGETLMARGRPILLAMEAMEAEVTAARGKPRGLIRVNTGNAFAKHRLVPALPTFRERYPEVQIQLSIEDRRVDVIGQQLDVVIRTGPLSDSALVARKIGEARRLICASADYVRRFGAPRTPEDLADHRCLILSGHERLTEWPFQTDGRVSSVRVTGDLACDNANVLYDMVRAGLGITRLSSFLMAEELASGEVVSLMEDRHVSEPVSVTALTPPGRQTLPRVRALIDFLIEQGV